MNVLLINASPRGEASSSYKVASAFALGIEQTENCSADIVHLAKKNIKPCKGCLHCWVGDTGECVIKDDDISRIHSKLVNADIVIISFPLYYFGMPALLSNFLDRSVCLARTYRGTNGNTKTGGFLHEWRYPHMNEQKYVFVSTCGYEFAGENYDAVRRRLDLIYGKDTHTDIFVGQGGVIAEKTLGDLIERNLTRFTEAGKEFAKNLSLSDETREILNKPILRHNTFVRALNMTWGLPVPKKGDNE